MAILINELVFKGTVAMPDAGDRKAPAAESTPPADVKTIVETCVAEVLRILEQRKER